MKSKSFNMMSLVVRIAVTITLFLIILQFKVSAQYEPVAQMIGIMDVQTKVLNTTYLDYEEQGAILRSSKFLVTEKAKGFVSSPSKVLYVNPGSALVSSNE